MREPSEALWAIAERIDVRARAESGKALSARAERIDLEMSAREPRGALVRCVGCSLYL